MKVAIIDSGVNKNVFDNLNIRQIRFYGGETIEEEPRDKVGHGTAVLSCLYKNFPELEYISLCPGIDENGVTDDIIEAADIANAIRYATKEGVSFMNISMGTTDFLNRDCIDEAVMEAYKAGIYVVASAPNEFHPALPWGSPGAIKAREKKGNGYKVTVEKDWFGIRNFTVSCRLFRVTTTEGKSIFAHGNSYSAVWITARLIEKALQNPDYTLEQTVAAIMDESDEDVSKLITQKYELVRPVDRLKNPEFAGKKLILYSWTKEMHSIVRGCETEKYKIVGAVDFFRKGNVKKDIGILSHTKEYGVCVSGNIEDVKEKADVLVIGYLDQLEKLSEKFTFDYILDYNLKNDRLHVFSFDPVPPEWREKYEKEGVRLDTPLVFDADGYKEVMSNVQCFIPIKKPILSVFGTSSRQGKFTLQIGLKKALKRNKVSVYHMSTEHQAAVLGADLTFADGYGSDKIVTINSDDKIQLLKGLMVYIDNTSDADMVMVGGQSWVIPYNPRNQSFARYATFLEGVKPDRNILVINPILDSLEYVMDTINTIKGVCRCKTFATAFSDYTPYVKNGRVLYKKLDDEEKKELSAKWRGLLKLPCGCISDDSYMDTLAKETILQFS